MICLGAIDIFVMEISITLIEFVKFISVKFIKIFTKTLVVEYKDISMYDFSVLLISYFLSGYDNAVCECYVYL